MEAFISKQLEKHKRRNKRERKLEDRLNRSNNKRRMMREVVDRWDREDEIHEALKNWEVYV